MPSFAAALKDEIIRLARKETRVQLEPLRKSSVAYRSQIADLKRVVASLERSIKALRRVPKEPAAPLEGGKPNRFVAKGLVTLRARLGMSAEDMGGLAGVSGQSIRNWEAKISVPGKENRAALISLRSLGKREAQERLLQIKSKSRKTPSSTAKKR